LFKNEYEAITGDETRLLRTRLRLGVQRVLELALAFPLIAALTREKSELRHAAA
jgi:hypothetical protein